MFKHDLAGFSSAGRGVRNQDSMLCLCLSPEASLLGIADGLGGRAAGNVASNIAINELNKIFSTDWKDWDPKRICGLICDDLSKAELETPDYEGLSTTLTFCTVDSLMLRYGHVGDTRLYHLRNQGIVAVTKDQTEVQELVKQKILKPNQVKKYPRRNILLSALSAKRQFSPEIGYLKLLPGDRILLTSDGVHGLISKRIIRDASIASSNIADFIAEIKRIVECFSPKDDYTAVALEVRGDISVI